MPISSRDPDETRLSRMHSVGDYRRLVADQDANSIAELIRIRFRERYLLPVLDEHRHGFTMMAVGCLLIETLEAFRQGWLDTSKFIKERKMTLSQAAFHDFFRHQESFAAFSEKAADFYKGVRCGILHQAETTKGWHITRNGPLLDLQTKTVNAARFLSLLGTVLDDYCDELKSLEWEHPRWNAARKKLEQVCKNCVE